MAVRLALGLVVGGIFVWLAGRDIDLDALGRQLGAADPAWLVAGAMAILSGYFVRVGRWWLLLRQSAPAVSYAACVRPFFISYGLNNLLPARAGDAVRALAFSRRLGIAADQGVATLAVERLSDLIVLLAIAGGLTLWAGPDLIPEALTHAAAVVLGLVAIGLLGLFVLPDPVLSFLAAPRLLSLIGGRGRLARLHGHANGVLATLKRLSAARTLSGLLGLAALGWALEGLTFMAVAQAVGYDGGPAGPWLAFAFGTLATLLPGPPGYVGSFHFFAAQGALLGGASPAAAMALAILGHAVIWGSTTAGALLAWLVDGRRPAGGVPPAPGPESYRKNATLL